MNLFITGAITKGLAGEELAPIGSLKQAGVVALTDDGHCVQNHEVMRRALEYAAHVRPRRSWTIARTTISSAKV